MPDHDRSSVPVGIGDDAAILLPSSGKALVASTDSLIPDRHFSSDWSPAAIGHLALAVNLSDLAAMGARPRWGLLSLTLPDADTVWLDGFLDGFIALAVEHGLVLVGGNLARGPLNIGVQVLGDVDVDDVRRSMGGVLRSTARLDDVIAVTGTLGDAAAAFTLKEQATQALHQRWQRPTPRVAAGQILADFAHSMMDISDGLLADLTKLLQASQRGAVLDLARLPSSEALRACVTNPQQRRRLQAEGGSDYELLLTLGADRVADAQAELGAIGETLTVIGHVSDGGILSFEDDTVYNNDGEHFDPEDLKRNGWDHFQL